MNKPNPEKVTELIKKLTAETIGGVSKTRAQITHKQLVRGAIGHDIAQYCPSPIHLSYWRYIKREENRDKLIAELIEELNLESIYLKEVEE